MKRIIFSFLFYTSIAFTPALFGQVDENRSSAVQLEMGQSVHKEMKTTEIHKYRISLKSNQFLYGYVNQQGFDIVVKIFDPLRKKVDEVNRPHSDSDPENIILFSKHSGDYVIEIHPSGKLTAGGKYTIKLQSLEKAAEGSIDLFERATMAKFFK